MQYKRHRLYFVWVNIKSRCNNPHNTGFANYGGRGITYDPKWETFKGFLGDMGSSFKEGLQIDRIDNYGNYNKENCRWATRIENGSNKRNNKNMTYKGITQTLNQWARTIGIKRSTLANRIYLFKWDIERALGTDTRYKKYKKIIITERILSKGGEIDLI